APQAGLIADAAKLAARALLAPANGYPPRLDEVAGSSSDELTAYRRSRTAALEAQEGGTSRGPLCDRFGWKEIQGVRAQPGWTAALRGTIRYALLAGVLAATAAVAGDRGASCGGVR